MMKIGEIVHYVSLGSADGKFPSVCRAAVITEVCDENWSVVSLAVLNPTGLFFDKDIWYAPMLPGKWHKIENCSG